MAREIWGNVSLEDGKVHYFAMGELHCWMKYHHEEIWIAHCHNHEVKQKPNSEAPPEEIEWQRWATQNGKGHVNILPVFPDLPLVVNSEYALKISPGTRIQIFCRFPIWVRIRLPETTYTLIEMPTIKLSRTWFGTPTEGELCYFAKTKARRDLSNVDKRPNMVACPIRVVNKSGDELNFEHFCFRVERLSMYRNEEGFWADETQIIYQGEDLNSDVIMTGNLPKGITKKDLVSRPRKEIHKSLATRTFKRFFEDTSLIFGR